MAGVVPAAAGGWGLLGVEVEVEVVGKQDSLAAWVPRHLASTACSVWRGPGQEDCGVRKAKLMGGQGS